MPRTQSERLSSSRPLTTGVVASLLHVTTTTVRKMCERGELPGAVRVGNWWRIPASAVKPYLPEEPEAEQ